MSAIARLGQAAAPYVLSILRIVAGLLFLQHGLAKLVGYPHVAAFDTLQPFSWPAGIAGIIEVIGAPLLILGLFTRPVALILSGEMAIAYFMAHAPRGFIPLLNGGEAAVFFCFVFLYLAAAGGGAWSLDRINARSSAAG
jgi:putative oxidoreductase